VAKNFFGFSMQAEQDMLDLKNCREHRRRVIGKVKVYDFKLFCQVKGLLINIKYYPKESFSSFSFSSSSSSSESE
jgi:hypothetical protein